MTECFQFKNKYVKMWYKDVRFTLDHFTIVNKKLKYLAEFNQGKRIYK